MLVSEAQYPVPAEGGKQLPPVGVRDRLGGIDAKDGGAQDGLVRDDGDHRKVLSTKYAITLNQMTDLPNA